MFHLPGVSRNRWGGHSLSESDQSTETVPYSSVPRMARNRLGGQWTLSESDLNTETVPYSRVPGVARKRRGGHPIS